MANTEINYEAEVKKVYPDAFEHCYLGYWSIRTGQYQRINKNPDLYSDTGKGANEAWKLTYEILVNNGKIKPATPLRQKAHPNR